jgi:hypothetical protein
MADWQPRAGETLLIPSGGQGDHLFVVLNNPKALPGYGPNPQVVLVNLTTIHEGAVHDATCVLEPGCHPFVRQASFVNYRGTRVELAEHLRKLVSQGYFKLHTPMPGAEFARIRAGLAVSPFTKRELKQMNI